MSKLNKPPELRNYRLLYFGEEVISAWSETAAIQVVSNKTPDVAIVIVSESHPVLSLEPPSDDE